MLGGLGSSGPPVATTQPTPPPRPAGEFPPSPPPTRTTWTPPWAPWAPQGFLCGQRGHLPWTSVLWVLGRNWCMYHDVCVCERDRGREGGREGERERQKDVSWHTCMLSTCIHVCNVGVIVTGGGKRCTKKPDFLPKYLTTPLLIFQRITDPCTPLLTTCIHVHVHSPITDNRVQRSCPCMCNTVGVWCVLVAGLKEFQHSWPIGWI